MANGQDSLVRENARLRSENLRLHEQIRILKGAAHAMRDGVNAFMGTWIEVVDATGLPDAEPEL